VAASLPDKHKVASNLESDNDEFVTYPQAERFAVDKTENNLCPNEDGLHACRMKAVRYDGRAGERRREARAIKYRSDCAAAVELQMAMYCFLCNCEKMEYSCKECNWVSSW
jgi:hypothetical protein